MAAEIYDATGQLVHDRRHERRREDDPDAETIRGVNYWARLLILHKGKLLFIGGMLGGIGGYFAGWGARVSDFEAVKAEVIRNRGEFIQLRSTVADIHNGQKLQRYIMCVSVPKNAPEDAHTVCSKIIEEGP
jgi:hypothetical protein